MLRRLRERWPTRRYDSRTQAPAALEPRRRLIGIRARSAWSHVLRSGFPIPGFFRSQGGDLFLASERNSLRLPAYSRVDLRANKAFLFEKWKLTLSAELLNVTNHKNLRIPIIDGIDPTTGRVFHHFGTTMPVLPALGVAIEF